MDDWKRCLGVFAAAVLLLATPADARRVKRGGAKNPVRQAACVAECDTVRNLIYMIGDGMGLAHVTMLQIAEGYDNPVSFMRAENVALIKSYSRNNRVTDSAAAGTALATGHKTNNSMLGVLPDSTAVESMMAGNGDGAGRDLLPAPCHAGSLLCASGLQADARTDRRTAGRERRRCGVRRREALFHRTPGGRNDARRSVADEGIPCDRHPCGRRYDHVGQGRRAVRIQAHALCTQGARRLSSPRRREGVGDSVERRCGAGRRLHARGRGVDDRLRVAP